MKSASRDEARAQLLAAHGWSDAAVVALPADASPRSYQRLRHPDGRRAILMDAAPNLEATPCPADADPSARAALGYQAQARLAGLNLAAFVGIAEALTARGFSAPRVFGGDTASGHVLLEDLGEALFVEEIARGADPSPLYAGAIDTLAAIRRATFPATVHAKSLGGSGAPGTAPEWTILSYDHVALQAEADLFLDYYVRHAEGADVDAVARRDWRDAWADAFAGLEREGPCLTLRDVHASNLIWLPERDATAQVGLLDFQDALFGHPAYDVVSLLEDARRDVEPRLIAPMIERYVGRACLHDPDGFARSYAVLGAQRNAKILGVFYRLEHAYKRPGYMRFVPRVARLFAHDLDQPGLADLRGLVARLAPSVWEARRA